MSTQTLERSGTHENWTFVVIALATALVIVAFACAFVILPHFQRNRETASIKQAVEHALGFHAHEQLMTTQPSLRVPSYIVWNEETIRAASSGDAKRGEFIAINCTACHGEKGMTEQTWIPNLAGVDRLVLYKQLEDFRSGTRLSGPMSAIAQSLTPQQWADVAAYFSALPGLPETTAEMIPQSGRSLHEEDSTKRLIFAGDPKRGIPGCATCHGPAGYRLSAPALSRQNADYICQQLQNFSQGTRANDIYMPMRTIARLLEPEEMHALAAAYSVGVPGPEQGR
jgi:cytochrome c553